jgi:hypothetical protein
MRRPTDGDTTAPVAKVVPIYSAMEPQRGAQAECLATYGVTAATLIAGRMKMLRSTGDLDSAECTAAAGLPAPTWATMERGESADPAAFDVVGLFLLRMLRLSPDPPHEHFDFPHDAAARARCMDRFGRAFLRNCAAKYRADHGEAGRPLPAAAAAQRARVPLDVWRRVENAGGAGEPWEAPLFAFFSGAASGPDPAPASVG